MKVKLKRPHEHAGIRYAPESVINVDAATAEWLIQHGVVDAPPSDVAPVDTGSEAEGDTTPSGRRASRVRAM